MSNISNLQELCGMSEEAINVIVENSKNAKLIYEFLNKTKRDMGIIEKEFDFEDVDDFNEVERKIETDKNIKKEKVSKKAEEPKKSIFTKKTSAKNLKKK